MCLVVTEYFSILVGCLVWKAWGTVREVTIVLKKAEKATANSRTELLHLTILHCVLWPMYFGVQGTICSTLGWGMAWLPCVWVYGNFPSSGLTRKCRDRVNTTSWTPNLVNFGGWPSNFICEFYEWGRIVNQLLPSSEGRWRVSHPVQCNCFLCIEY